MPDLPMGLMPKDEAQQVAWKKWLQVLGGGGLAIFISLAALAFAASLYRTHISNMNEDRAYARKQDEQRREEEKEYRQVLLDQATKQAENSAASLEVHRATKEVIAETNETLGDLKDEISNLTNQSKQSQMRMDRIMEKAWGLKPVNPEEQLQPTPQ